MNTTAIIAAAVVLSGSLGFVAVILLTVAVWLAFRRPAPAPVVRRSISPQTVAKGPPPPPPSMRSLVPIDGSKIGQRAPYSLPPSINLLDPDTTESVLTEHVSRLGIQPLPLDEDTDQERTEIFHDSRMETGEMARLDDTTGSALRRR